MRGRSRLNGLGPGPCSQLAPASRGGRGWARPMADDEADLLRRAQGGDRQAYGRLVRAHQRRVYACAVQMLAEAGEAEDAVQETFLRAWRALPRFDGRSELS